MESDDPTGSSSGGGMWQRVAEEEYTDYSCSTALERLSRDVETILRAWHVDKGSDHHVSVRNADSTAVDAHAQHQTCALIRSNPIVWHVPLRSLDNNANGVHRKSMTVDLELALWDAPMANSPDRISTNNNNALSPSAGANDSAASSLVKSLQRVPFGDMVAEDSLFGNFSRLFGIGQHITLTPIQAHPIPEELLEVLGSQILQRHDRLATAPMVLGSTLSAWLQTSLNVAVANCRCAIPAFGVWGSYKPDQNPTYSKDTINQNGHAHVYTFQRKHEHGKNGDLLVGTTIQTMTGSVSSASDRQDLHEKGHPNGVHLQHQDSVLSVGTPSASPTAGSSSSLAGTSIAGPSPKSQGGDTSYQSLPKGIPVFPKWAEAIQQAGLPSTSRFFERNARSSFWNQCYIPPIICGNVSGGVAARSTPINSPAFAAKMWVSATTSQAALADSSSRGWFDNTISGHRATATHPSTNRLSVWANVLLRNCPGESTCALHGARHVFGWLKQNPRSLSYRSDSTGLTSRRNTAASDVTAQEWREINTILTLTPRPEDDEFDVYRKHCRAHTLDVLEEAWQQSPSNPLPIEKLSPIWGPLDDPVSSVYATTTWCGKKANSPNRAATEPEGNGQSVVEPLMTFPMRIRSRREVSKRDWMDMEESVETTILDPLQPSRFLVQAFYDRDTPVATLTASQRCILAGLIRSATLPGETLLHHLTSTELVGLWDDDAGTNVATKLAEKSRVGTATTQIVRAMDWSSIMEDMISVKEAEAIVHDIMKGEMTAGFPSSPEDSFLQKDDLHRPFEKTAPYGRLLSTLFAHMARLRALSSMVLLWNVFLEEVRRRWHARESLPNMQYVAGLDPHPLELYKKRSFSSIGHKANFSAFLNCSEPDPDDYHCLIGQKLQVFNIGVECIVAREILEHEVMERFLNQGQIPSTAVMLGNAFGPQQSEDTGQVLGADMLEHDPVRVQKDSGLHRKNAKGNSKWPKSRQPLKSSSSDGDSRKDYGPPVINSDLEFWVMDEPGYAPRDQSLDFTATQTDDTGFDFVAPPPKDLDELDAPENVLEFRRQSMVVDILPDVSGWEGTIMEDAEDDDDDDDDGSNDSAASRTTNCSLSQAYFDAAEAGSIFSMKHGFVSLDTVVNVADMRRRPGARCPVQGRTLRNTGDQLYAPYLQRPCPLTDDLVMERKHMLTADQRGREDRKRVLQVRINIAHRLQRSKLLSDMSSFKAANPNATIDDFTQWYGNPGSPLDEYDEPLPDDVSVADAFYESAAKKLDRASEAMKVLTATRDFWASTWDEAKPVPAAEQEALFDYETTVEMALDYLEQMHPANLVSQVLAVNLSSAFFTLVTSAEDAMKIPMVETALRKLRKVIEQALSLLSDDTTGALFQTGIDLASTATATANQNISEESIFACEAACNALGVTETMVARAISLLSKLPGQYSLVQDLLRLSDGTPVALVNPAGRKGFLDAIYLQQRSHLSHSRSHEGLPSPVLREYVLRNHNDEQPCQLAVRFGDKSAYLDRVDNDGGVLLALMKTYLE